MPVLVHDGLYRESCWRAHYAGISASQMAKAMTPSGRRDVLAEMLAPREVDQRDSRMAVFMEHGSRREAEFIGDWIERRYGIPHNSALWAHAEHPKHLATPDGYNPENGDLAEFKTSTKPKPKTIPRVHRDQMTWQMYVMEGRRVLYVHEQHNDFRPVNMPVAEWFDRDQKRVDEMRRVADGLLFEAEMERANRG